MKLIIKNAKVVNADGASEEAVFVADGKIVAAFPEEEADRVIDGTGKVLMPGAIDTHVHFREPGAEHKEVWETGSSAAAMGGVTTVLDMPNNNPAIISVENLEKKREIVKGRSYVNYGFFFGAAGNGNVDEIRKAENIAGVKVYMGSSTGDLLVDKPSVWEDVFQVCKEVDVPVVVHAENEERIRSRMKHFSGQKEIVTHAKIRDCECAHIAADAAVELRAKVGNRLHIAHMSCKEELALVRENLCLELSCEVCPHHLYFSMEDMEDAFLKMNPPLRHKEDLVALWEGVRDGSVSCLATDHAPHTIEEKSNGLNSPSGVPGVQFLLPLMLNEVNEKMLDLPWLVQQISVGASEVFRLQNKGWVKEGYDADLVLVDMNMEKTVTRDMVQSKCGWSPYEGYKLKGWPVMTIVQGEVVMEDGKMVGEFVGKEVEIG